MKRHFKRISVFLSIAVVLFVLSVTVLHHHPLNEPADHDCEICKFITTAHTSILPAVVFLFILTVFTAIILLLNKGISSENVKVYSSRAPPSVPAI